MKERPILFSAPMVRAILSGAKTQTRRIVKNAHMMSVDGELVPIAAFCPYGQPGGRLWVRETFACVCTQEMRYVEYKADRSLADFDGYDNPAGGRWRPSIHMPRWASRITLEITDVRVERLQDISEADAVAEGARPTLAPLDTVRLGAAGTAKEGFRQIWESINGPGSWDANPWVWAIEFKKLELPGDGHGDKFSPSTDGYPRAGVLCGHD